LPHTPLTCRTRAVTWDPAISKYFPSIFWIAWLTSLESSQFCQCSRTNTRYMTFDPKAYLDLSSLLTSWHLIFSHNFASSCQYYLGVNQAKANLDWQTYEFTTHYYISQGSSSIMHTLIFDN
jgi:hypothetical protein